jgi:hypothetical protein
MIHCFNLIGDIMRILSILLICCINWTWACCIPAKANAQIQDIQDQLSKVEKAYPFCGSKPSDADQGLRNLPLVKNNRNLQDPDNPIFYNSVLLTMAATLRSRKFDRGSGWERIELSYPKGRDNVSRDPYYQKDIHAYLRKAQESNSTLFILVPGIYASFKSGSMINQMVATLDKVMPGSHFLAFNGLLTDEFLNFKPRLSDPRMDLLSHDIYYRLQAYLQHYPNNSDWRASLENVYLITFSGSGTVAFRMLGIDGELMEMHHSDDTPPKPLFTQAIAFSPILHFRTTCDNLDSAINAMLADKKRPLLKENQSFKSWPYVLSITANILLPSGIEYLLKATRPEPSSLKRKRTITKLFYNEFFYIDLKRVIEKESGSEFKWQFGAHLKEDDLPLTRGNRYRHFYQRYAYWRYRKEILKESITANQFLRQCHDSDFDELYDKYLDEIPLLKKAKVPLYIVFPLDDPVVSSYAYAETHSISPELEETIDRLQQIPNIRLFTPKYGAHMAYFLDDLWIKQVVSIFFQ